MSFLEPEPTPATAPFWDGVRAGVLRLQRGRTTRRCFFYPRPHSPFDPDEEVEWFDASGRATLVSYIINHRPLPDVDVLSPIIALVRLEEGPTLMTNIVDVEPDPAHLALDMDLQVVFRAAGDAVLPVFTPVFTPTTSAASAGEVRA